MSICIALLEASLAESLEAARDQTDDDDGYDPNAYLRHTIAEALALLADPAAFEPLVSAIETDTGYVRATEIETLGWLGDARAFDALVAIARDPSDPGRHAAVKALGLMKDSRAVGTLIDILKEDDTAPHLRELLAGWRHDEESIDRIVDCIDDPPLDTGDDPTGVLALYTSGFEHYMKSLRYWSQSTQLEASLALEIIGDDEGRKAVDRYLGDADLEGMARDYRALIRKWDTDFYYLFPIVLERYGTLEMAEDIWRVHGYGAADWAQRRGLLDQLEASKNSPDRPRLGQGGGD
ncbi:MAG: HEAT repeat domain-containing protein [Planctomycetota bacterium]|jgi:HEAT repeat protein